MNRSRFGVKSRAGGRMTEAEFLGRLRSALRAEWRKWPPRSDVLRNATRKMKKPMGRRRVEVHCAICRRWFDRERMSVDHVIPCGSFNLQTAGEFISRMFVEEDGLQVLCDTCHKRKTREERKKI